MFQDPNMPDFDSMSQEELIQWLETLARRQYDSEAGAGEDYDPAQDELYPEPELLNDEEWSAWIEEDEDLQQETPPIRAPQLHALQDLDEDDDETPTNLPVIDEAASDDTTDPLTELDELLVLTEAPVAEQAAADERLETEDLEDPLEWLESLASEVSEAALDIPVAGGVGETFEDLDDIDDAWEDDERHEDAEDESLYSRGLQETVAFLESLAGLDEDEYSTQSMAPLPDELIPESEADDGEFEEAAVDLGILAGSPSLAPRDNLMQAFLLQEHEAGLEAWYEARLRAIAGGSDTAVRTAADRELDLSTLAPPPPGLSAGFNSARGKLADGRLAEALRDYETILRANIGLDLVVNDMRWLLAQAAYRSNPAVLRVLGDALMRQGHLQDALDVYRYALKLL